LDKLIDKGEDFIMASFQEKMDEYRKQLRKGIISQAYKGLMEYLLHLRTHFKNAHPDILVPGTFYSGYMDMTYFSLVPKSLKQHNLKIAVIFLHETFRFDVWLAGANKQVQAKYWNIFNESSWKKYPIVASPKGTDAIIEHVLVENPDFSKLDELTAAIEKGTLHFIEEIQKFLSRK